MIATLDPKLAWFQTHSGRQFHYVGGSPDEICIEDIAVALSRMPRFAGHTKEFYSVAQHSVLVCDLIATKDADIRTQLLGLLHDATEAYVCDLPRMLKCMLPDFKELERGVWDKISLYFFGEHVELPSIIKECDNAILAAEARDILPKPAAWLPHWSLPEPPTDAIIAWAPETARHTFLGRFAQIVKLSNLLNT